MAMTGRNDLVDRRREAADGEFERYDMGGETVEDSSGWEYTIPGTEMSRPVFFRNADDPDADSVTGHFRVVFAASDSAEVVEAYAAIRGSEFGTRVPPEPAAASGRAP